MKLVDKRTDISDIDFLEGAVILIDKPKDWTSFDVVNKIRFHLRDLYGIKKIKVGHNGTLDPLATGLLMIFTGKYTKLIPQHDQYDKAYRGIIKIGATTASLDAELPEENIMPYDHVTDTLIKEKAESFLGESEQVIPIYSAVKQNGQALYKLARKGKKVKPKSRLVKIDYFNIDEINLPYINFDVKCSKGTYIRALARDIGECMETSAYLYKLERTEIGNFSIENALDVQTFCQAIKNKKV